MIKLYSLYFYCLPYAMFWANESLPGFPTSPLLAKRCSPKMRSLYLALDATLLTDLSSELQDLPAGCFYLNVPPSPPAQNAPRGTQPLPPRIAPLFVFSISNWHQNLLESHLESILEPSFLSHPPNLICHQVLKMRPPYNPSNSASSLLSVHLSG